MTKHLLLLFVFAGSAVAVDPAPAPTVDESSRLLRNPDWSKRQKAAQYIATHHKEKAVDLLPLIAETLGESIQEPPDSKKFATPTQSERNHTIAVLWNAANATGPMRVKPSLTLMTSDKAASRIGGVCIYASAAIAKIPGTDFDTVHKACVAILDKDTNRNTK